MRKLARISTIIALIFALTTVSNATTAHANLSGEVSVDEYFESVNAVFEEYGIHYAIEEIPHEVFISEETRRSAVQNARQIAESIEVTLISNNLDEFSSFNTLRGAVSSFSYGCLWRASSVLGDAYFETVVQGDIDLISASIVRFTTFRTRFSHGMNYSTHALISQSVDDLPLGNVSWSVEMSTTFEWTEPNTGIKQTVTVYPTVGDQFDAHDYLV